MKSIFLTLLFALTFSAFLNAQDLEKNHDKITVYYLVRHAEKDRTNPENKNPVLTTEGLNRAENWKTVLSNISFDLVFTTDYHRTQQTALPLANHNKLKPKKYEANNLVNNTFLEETRGKNIFVVGHSDNIPKIVNALIGQNKYQEIDDSENGSLFIVTIYGSHVSEQLLIIN